MTPAVAIRVATRHDIPAMMALEAKYYVGNLDRSERATGFISNLQSKDWFTWAVDSAGIHVAVTDDDSVVGFIGVTDPPSRSQVGSSPILQAVLDLAESLTFNGIPIAQQRFALRGPVCLDESVRGRGIYSAFNAATRTAYRDRFDLGVLFVAADNPRSLHTTTTKLGATSLAVFEVDSQQYNFLAFSF
ncbi:hypothetical protein ACQ86B_14690 [Mycolicibacterium aichiense]|uniref:hypothetical protein n=1 Tax=Mycolicibacterium aichiense TaxID=1799 RepID=UPI003D67D334